MAVDSTTDAIIDEKISDVIMEPRRFKVIFLNDDVTPMEFVIELLMAVFRHTETSAKDLTLKIHNDGSAVVGIYTHEIAEQRLFESTQLARNSGFPLQVRAEEE
jgi:ATP-dependent Clp protease adaptor protein ClpS